METVSVIVYRSRSAGPASDIDLLYLLAQARARNELEGITGLLLYDRGRFYQWIEGAERPLRAVWESILRDERHTHVELLADQRQPFRLFREWSMGFAHRDSQFGQFMDGFTEADAGLLDDLHHSTDGVPRILARFSSLPTPFDDPRIVPSQP